MPSSYNILIEKLNEFIRKYYTNLILRGLLISCAFIIAGFICITSLEYNLYLPGFWRAVLFYGFIFCSLLLLASLVLLPFLKRNRIGKTLSYEDASQIIGTHFAEVKDTLLNVLQLHKNEQTHNNDSDLLRAAIDQKIATLKPISFPSAIDLAQNKKYLKYALPPLFAFLIILFAAPSVFKDGTNRLFHSDQFYEKEMPFRIRIINSKLEVLENQNLTLQIETDGDILPDKVSILYNGLVYDMKKVDKTHFEYLFSNIQNNISFQFSAASFTTKPYVIKVLPKPTVVSFDVHLSYPNYTGKKPETLKNTGDLTLPQGTQVTWTFYTKETEAILIEFNGSESKIQAISNSKYTYSKTINQSSRYNIKASNTYVKNNDSVFYTIQIIPDLYPEITVQEFKDSANQYSLFYSGDATDDYGINALNFVCDIKKRDSSKIVHTTKNLTVSKGSKYAQFTHYLDVKSIGLLPGDEVTYYFEVRDISGKTSRSSIKHYKAPTIEEREKATDKNNETIKDQLEKYSNESKEIAKEMKKLQERMLQKKQSDWNDKKQLQDIVNRQKQLQENVEKMKNQMEQNHQQQDEYKETDTEIKEKQKQLEKLMEDVLSDEMKEMIKKLEKMMEQLNKQDIMKNTEEMKMNDEKLNKELDRMLELFKKIEQEQKIKETSEKLEKLAQEQEKLSKESLEKNSDSKELKDKQNALNNKMKDIQNEMKDIEKMNEKLEEKADMKEAEESINKAEEEMQQSGNDLEKNDKKNASSKQQSAAQKMKQASEQMKNQLGQQQEEQLQEDMNSLRQLLENLISLSIDQERIMDETKRSTINTPKYVSLIQQQKKIAEDSKMIEDSLYALAKRQIQIEAIVTKEITDINKYQNYVLRSLEDRNISESVVRQQMIMTGYNNLALLLSEALQQMQQQMQQMKNQKPGSGACKKPGGKGGTKPSMSQLSKMQQQLNDQMQKVGEMIKNGQMKPGDKGYSKEMAQMAQQQAAIREALQELNKNESGDGKSAGSFQKLAQMMNQTETELVNKRLTEEMLKRQQEITVKMLDYEKAQKERGEKEEREATSASDKQVKMPPSMEEYIKKRNQELELYKTLPLNLKPFYKNMVQEYYKAIGKR